MNKKWFEFRLDVHSVTQSVDNLPIQSYIFKQLNIWVTLWTHSIFSCLVHYYSEIGWICMIIFAYNLLVKACDVSQETNVQTCLICWFATKRLCSGGTSVTGALECPENEKRMIVSVDMSQMVSSSRQFSLSIKQSRLISLTVTNSQLHCFRWTLCITI